MAFAWGAGSGYDPSTFHGKRHVPQLHILSGKRQGDVVELKSGDEVDIGNRKSARLSIRDPWVSYNHARILTEAGRFVIEDQESSNGTWLDAPSGPKKIKRHELTPNDVFALGKTRIRFVADVPAPVATPVRPPAPGGTSSFASGPGVTRRLPNEAAWWDQGVEVGPSKAEAAARADGSLEQQLREERKMREALERFLELPPGSTPGDAARAGALEREVAELKQQLAQGGASSDAVEKVRRELMTRQVELEDRASAAEGKLVDLERRLVEKSEQSKKELARAREKAQAEVDELKQALEEARKSARDGGDAALAAATQRVEKLEQERDEWREKARQAEEQLAELEAKAEAAGPELQARLDEALAEAARFKREHQAVIQEIDEISMEQIEIEDGLKARVKELEARLLESGGDVGGELGGGNGTAAPTPPPTAPRPASKPAREAASVAGSRVEDDARAEGPEELELTSGAGDERDERGVATYDSASLGVLPTSELGGPPAMDDADMEGSADLTASSESTDEA